MSSLAPPKTSGIGSRDGADPGRFGVDEERHPDHDRAEVEGPGDGRRDHRQRERRALVGAGEVGLAGDLDRRGAAAGADRRALPTWLFVGQLGCFGLRRAGAGRRPRRSSFRRAVGDALQLAGQPRGQGTSTPFSSCWPSLRVMWTAKGLKAPALSLFGSVEKPGAKGRAASVFAQAPPPGALRQREAAVGVAAGVPE